MNIATAKDLDVLLAQLKGDKADMLLQAVEEAHQEMAGGVEDSELGGDNGTEEESKMGASTNISSTM